MPLSPEPTRRSHARACVCTAIPDAAACYEKLTRFARPRASRPKDTGASAIIKAANDDVSRRGKGQAEGSERLRVRWGYVYLDHWQPNWPADLFNEALEIDEKYAPALIGLARAGGGGLSRRGHRICRSTRWRLDPKSYQARGSAGARRARRQQRRQGRGGGEKGASTCRPRLWTRWRFWRPSTGWTIKKDSPWLAKDSQSQSACTAKRTISPGISSSSIAAMTKGSRLPQGDRARSGVVEARAASWA